MKKQKKMKIFYTDERTGRYSSTVLRTWILFSLFVAFGVACAVLAIIDLCNNWYRSFANLLSILEVLGFAAFGGGGLYLGRRVFDKNHGNDERFITKKTENNDGL